MEVAQVPALVTGERVSTAAGGFNPTFQRHVAAYEQSARFLPPRGRVLDLGAGAGHSFGLLAPRETVGVDRSATALRGQDRLTVVADMRALPFAENAFDGALAVQSIEHVPDPERVLGELVRVLRPGAPAVFVTPNRLTFARPDEVIDPYHFVEYDPAELAGLLRPFFATVEIAGLFGSPAYEAVVAREHARLDALLARDPLRARRLVPRRVRRRLYDGLLRRARRRSDIQDVAIGPADFELRRAPARMQGCLDVIGVGTLPG